MRVAIDIRRAGNFGIGTYIRNIVNQFARTDSETEYLLIGEQRHLQQLDPLPDNYKLLDYAYEPGSFHTHMHLPFLLRKHGVDILHMPWFYAPAVVPSRLVITVHDLTDVLAPRVGASPLVQAGRMYFARRARARTASWLFRIRPSGISPAGSAFPRKKSRSSTTRSTNGSCGSQCPPTPTAFWNATR